MTNNKSARDWAIFRNINYERYSDVERMTAIEHIAYAPTHNSITKAMMLDVIRYLLTAQQPRVLTLDEVMKHYSLPPVFVDDLNMQEDYLQDIQPLYFEFQPDRPWDVHWINYNQVANIYKGITARYGTIIRAWSARPTDEQRKAVKWDATDKGGY